MRRPVRCLVLALLAWCALCAAALAAAPPAREGSEAPLADGEKAGAVETVKRAAHAQAEVSPQTREALKGGPAGVQPVRGGSVQSPGNAPGQAGRKTIYGDIVIHK